MISFSAKRSLLGLTFLLVILQSEAAPAPIYPYKCFVKIRGSKTLEKGYLYAISDSTIFIAKNYRQLLAADSIPNYLKRISVNEKLMQIRIRNRSAGSVGGLAGFGTALIVTLVATKNVSTSLEGGLAMAFVVVPLVCIGGAVTGALVANASSLAVYNYGHSAEKELTRVSSYSYVNWLEMKKKK